MRTRPPSEASIMAAITRHVEINGKAMKYADLITTLADDTSDRTEWSWLYREVGKLTQRLKNLGRLELVKGRGAGWTIPREAAAK